MILVGLLGVASVCPANEAVNQLPEIDPRMLGGFRQQAFGRKAGKGVDLQQVGLARSSSSMMSIRARSRPPTTRLAFRANSRHFRQVRLESPYRSDARYLSLVFRFIIEELALGHDADRGQRLFFQQADRQFRPADELLHQAGIVLGHDLRRMAGLPGSAGSLQTKTSMLLPLEIALTTQGQPILPANADRPQSRRHDTAGVGKPAFSQAFLVATLSIPSREALDPLPTNGELALLEDFLKLAALPELAVKDREKSRRRDDRGPTDRSAKRRCQTPHAQRT